MNSGLLRYSVCIPCSAAKLVTVRTFLYFTDLWLQVAADEQFRLLGLGYGVHVARVDGKLDVERR